MITGYKAKSGHISWSSFGWAVAGIFLVLCTEHRYRDQERRGELAMTTGEHNPDEGEVLVVAMARPSMVGAFTMSSVLISIFAPLIAALLIRSLWPVALIPVLFGAS